MKLAYGKLGEFMWPKSNTVKRYAGRGIGGFYLVILQRWFLYVDWIR